MRRARGAWALGMAVALACVSASASEPTEQQIDAMTDAIVSLVPLGKVMEQAAAANPQWPVQDKPEAVTAGQLACLRKELSADGFRRFKREEVADYLKTHTARFDEELKVTRSAAPLYASIMMAGADAATQKKSLSMEQVLAKADADQLMAMLTLARDPKFRDLRELTGFGDAMAGEGSSEDNEATGQLLAMKAMFHGMKQCDVSPGSLF